MIPGLCYPLMLSVLAYLLVVQVLLGIRPALIATAQVSSLALAWLIHRTHRAPAEDGETNGEGMETSVPS